MYTIPIVVAGDQWRNRQQVIDLIGRAQGQPSLMFEVNSEGPSLGALGVIDVIQHEISKIGIAQDHVWIDRWHNNVECIPFRRAFEPGLSHFFWMSNDYRHQEPDHSDRQLRFGLFVGRITTERACMLYHIYHNMAGQALLSVMQNHAPPDLSPQDIAGWMPGREQQIMSWFQHCPIKSITDSYVQHQYQAGYNTNADLIRHYNKFTVEIVCETYCLGDAFFPTEKTVRPISKMKPMVVFGPRGFLARLRELGFRTWQHLWNEDYDALQGVERYQAIKSTLSQIQNLDSELIRQDRTVSHNLQVLQDLIHRHRPS